MRLSLDVLDGVLNVDNAALRTGDSAANNEHIQLGINFNNFKVLNSYLLAAHMTCADLAREDAGGIGARAHRTCVTVNRTAAVAGGSSLSAPALDNAGVALTLGDACDVNLVALGKNVRLDNVADVESGAILEAELLEVLFKGNARFFKVTLFRLGELALRLILITELNGLIALFFSGLLLDNDVGTGFNNGYRNDVARLIEDLRHADLFADDSFLHNYIPPVRLLVRWLSLLGYSQRPLT